MVKKYKNNKGFAVSGILYPILILTLFLVVQILTMMASRKTVLDKNKEQLLDSVNRSNKIYSNEELSILVGELQATVATLKTENETLKNKNNTLNTEFTNYKNTTTPKLNEINASLPKRQFFVLAPQAVSKNLDNENENSPSTIRFDPNTVGKPTACDYGIVVMYMFGEQAAAANGGYWRFQTAHCTKNLVYVRQAVNQQNWTAWREI